MGPFTEPLGPSQPDSPPLFAFPQHLPFLAPAKKKKIHLFKEDGTNVSNLPVSPVSDTEHPLRFYSVSLLSILKQ